MKKTVFLCLVFIVAVGIFAMGCQSDTSAPEPEVDISESVEEPIELKLSIDLPEGTDFAIAANKMAENIADRTNGQCLITVHAGGTLCSHAELFSMMKSGAIEMGESPIEYQADADLRFMALQLPFLFNSIEANYKSIHLFNENLFNDILAEKFNVMPIASFSTGVHQYYGTDDPVEVLDDWKGKLVWTANPLSANTISALGASPVSLEFWDGYPSLQKGTVDAAVNIIPLAVLLFQWYDSIHYITICNLFGSSSNIYINLDIFNEMPEDMQTILLDEAKKLEEEMQAIYAEHQVVVPEELKDFGVTVYQLPDDERARWIEATQSVREDYFSQLDPADVEIIMDCVAQANE
jgi:C4-dicarboxylate-binding protein DctP